MGLQIVQILYWLALSTWFGGVLFVAVAAPIIFRTVREANPVLPDVLSVNLEGQHGSLLAGSIVGNLLAMLYRVQIACAAVLLIMLILQWFLIPQTSANLFGGIVRSALFLAAAALAAYDRFVLWPRIWSNRQTYIDNADNPDVANPAKELFDRYHRESVTILSVILFLLLGIILFSGNLASNGTTLTIQ